MQNGEMYRAGTPALSPRLMAAVGMVRRGVPACDIGCDHGKLAVYLVRAGISPRVIASDLNAMPLAKARALAAQTGCAEKIDCRLGSGLTVLTAGEAAGADIILAGMSGETMIEILEAAPFGWQRGTQLVLVPVTRVAQLRRWLCGHGFTLKAEQAVGDAGRVYVVMNAAYTGEAWNPSPLFCEKGLLNPQQDANAKSLLTRRAAYLRQRLLAPLEAQERAALEQLIQEVEQCLE